MLPHRVLLGRSGYLLWDASLRAGVAWPRVAGKLVCAKCSEARHVVPAIHPKESQRLCDLCWCSLIAVSKTDMQAMKKSPSFNRLNFKDY